MIAFTAATRADITWIGADGAPLSGDGWADPTARFLGWLLAGDRVDLLDAAGGTAAR